MLVHFQEEIDGRRNRRLKSVDVRRPMAREAPGGKVEAVEDNFVA